MQLGSLAIEVSGLAKSYGSVQAVKDVSFTVSAGECVAILGPNGAGKSTTVEIIEGFRTRDSGEVRVLGQDPALADGHWRARLGIVLQECGFEGFLKVREVLQLHARYYPAPRAVDEVLALCQLSEKADARVLRLSGGQRRKLDVALALIGDPELIFLDEPTTGFDPIARQAFWSVINDLRALGKTVVLTTHFLDEAEALADRLVLIIDGCVAATGTVHEIRSRSQGATVKFEFPRGLSVDAHNEFITLCTSLRASMLNPQEAGLRTNQPTLALAHLTAWAAKRKMELSNLRVERPTLEDIYTAMVREASTQGSRI